MLTWEERRKELLESQIFERNRSILEQCFLALENNKEFEVTELEITKVLYILYWDFALPYEIVHGIIMYFWCQKVFNAKKVFDLHRGNFTKYEHSRVKQFQGKYI